MEDVVAGYRVLRVAGRGDRARVLVGFDAGATVVLKASRAADPRVGVEIEALRRAAGEHVVALEDVAADESETVLVLERLANGTLADLLERRAGLDAGEAVTILAPLAATVERLHEAGVAHGALSLAAVCFRADGAPALVGFGAAELFAPASPEVVRETVPGVLADRAALRDLAQIVLGRVGGEHAAAARRLAAASGEAGPGQLASALFGFAAPAPVRFEADPADGVSVRVGEPREPVDAGPDPAPSLPSWLTGLLPEGLRERLLDSVQRGLSIWSAWPPRRRRLVVGAAAGGLVVLLALALVPPVPAGPTTAAPATTAATPEPAAALSDDPVEAATLLLDLRERCLRDLSLLCLDDVVQPESAAQADDFALIRSLQGGGEYPAGGIAAGSPVLVERLGDSALLDLPAGSEPSSVLLLRTTNGWRIRQYLTNEHRDAPAVTPEAGQMPRSAAKSPLSRRAFTAPRKRAASAPSTMRWSYDRAR